jgi:hypothetical protein
LRLVGIDDPLFPVGAGEEQAELRPPLVVLAVDGAGQQSPPPRELGAPAVAGRVGLVLLDHPIVVAAGVAAALRALGAGVSLVGP